MSQKFYKFNTGPLKGLLSPGPATVEEYDAASGGGENGALETAVRLDILHGHLPRGLHPQFAKIFAKHSGVERNVNTEATEKAKLKAKDASKVADVLESVPEFMARVWEIADASVKSAIDAECREFAKSTTIDVSPASRESGPGKENREIADRLLLAPTDKLEAKIAQMLERVPGYTVDRDDNNVPERDSLAGLVKAYFAADDLLA